MITTYRYDSFLPAGICTKLKKERGETISVVIPALNEASTIGPIISSIRQFSDRTDLIDEIIVMDGDSTDATKQCAHDAGALVVNVDSIAPTVSATGKGVALWKSQFVANGSIIVFIDADLLDFDERFIIGLAGALLHNDHLELVKASYRRPLANGSTTIEDNGGRVTELFLRPLLNLFLPDLAAIRQPLAGEYAIRSRSLATLPFYSGYGIETALLLEYYFTRGLPAIGQVDVGIRTHRNRSLPELSLMASEIGAVLFELLEEHNYCTNRRINNTISSVMESGELIHREITTMRLPPKNAFNGKRDHVY